jgi:hypothetical protein
MKDWQGEAQMRRVISAERQKTSDQISIQKWEFTTIM